MTNSKSHTPQSLGGRIAHERRLLGVREGRDVQVPDLAARVDVTAASVYNWEADVAVPGEANLGKLARLFGVTPGYLRYGDVSHVETKEELAKMANPAVDHRATEEELDRDERIVAGKQLAAKLAAKKAGKRKTG